MDSVGQIFGRTKALHGQAVPAVLPSFVVGGTMMQQRRLNVSGAAPPSPRRRCTNTSKPRVSYMRSACRRTKFFRKASPITGICLLVDRGMSQQIGCSRRDLAPNRVLIAASLEVITLNNAAKHFVDRQISKTLSCSYSRRGQPLHRRRQQRDRPGIPRERVGGSSTW